MLLLWSHVGRLHRFYCQIKGSYDVAIMLDELPLSEHTWPLSCARENLELDE